MEQNAVRSVAVTSVERLVRKKRAKMSQMGNRKVRGEAFRCKRTPKYWEQLMKMNFTTHIKFTERTQSYTGRVSPPKPFHINLSV